MEYRFLGNTGALVSELSLGTMTIGGVGYWEAIGTLEVEEAKSLFKTFYEAGGNFIDTANGYGFGKSESVTGQALKELGIPREHWVIATKALIRMDEGVNNVGLSRLHLYRSVNESLQRIQIEYIDLFQIHGVDPYTPIEETMCALNDLVRAGKIRYIGCCNLPAWMVAKANGIAEKNGWAKFVSTQNYYSIAGRDIEREIIPMALDSKMAVLPWSPLAGGFLTGKFTKENSNVAGARRTNFDFPPINKDLAYTLVDSMAIIAKELEVSVATIALSWMLRQPGITAPIIGAKNAAQLIDTLRAVETKHHLTDAHLHTLNDLSALSPEYPGWMLARQGAGRLPGGTVRK
jgi:aryl-alcohol dehydrogenase-like predicted oxidoreductase